METLSAHADGWLFVYAVLAALSLLSLMAVGLVALLTRRSTERVRRTVFAVCLLQLVALVMMPAVLAVRADGIASRFGAADSGFIAIAWSAPVLAVPSAIGLGFAVVLLRLLFRGS